MHNYPITRLQTSLGQALHEAKARLAATSSTASLDAQVLLAHLIGKPRAWLLAHPEAPLTPEQHAELERKLQQLELGTPLPYLLGAWEFFGLLFKITPDVLIPRPETELLVETALEWLDRKFLLQSCKGCPGGLAENLTGPILAADVGTGSGCIAVSLAVHCPELHLIATDLSPAALAVARHNAQAHGVSNRITFLETDLFPPTSQSSTFNLICANLPYIPTATLRTLAVFGREPTPALDGGPDGLALIRRLLAQAATRLAPGGLLLLEIDASQGETALALARQRFPRAQTEIYPDLAGLPRLLCVQTHPPA